MMQIGTRRHAAGRAAMTVAAAGMLVAAAFATTTQAGAARHAAAAKKPARGGSYVYRISSPPDCLDPQKTAAASSNFVDGLVLDTLLSVGPKGQYEGDLATGYKVTKGGTVLTFSLRKNVKFSNGDPFTAKDVKFTFDRALNPATKSPATATDLAAVQSTKVINNYTVELVLKTPSRPLLSGLASAYTGILDPKSINAEGSNTCQALVGTGLYKIQSTGTAFSDVVLTANTRHNFGPAWVQNKGVPWITKVEVLTIASDATAISELLSGGVDIVGVPGTQLSRVQGNSSIVLHTLRPQSLEFAELNTAAPPFNDPQMRKAFAEMINRTDIVTAAFSGQAAPVNGPLPPGVPFYDKAAAKYMPKYNISDASKIVSSKHATGPYTLLTVGLPTFSTMAEIIQQAAGQAGMQFNIVPKGGVSDFLAAATKGDYNALILGVGATDPDILDNLLDTKNLNGAGLNWTGDATNTKLDQLLRAGEVTLQSKKVAKIYDQAQVLINKQLEFLGICAPTSPVALRSTIKGYHVNVQNGVAFQDLYIKTK